MKNGQAPQEEHSLAEVMARLKSEFELVTYERPAPGGDVGVPVAIITETSKRPHQKAWFGLAASILAVTAVVSTSMFQTSQPAWAAEPLILETGAEEQIVAACSDRFSQGPGELQQSGSASIGSDSLPTAGTDAELPIPAQLPEKVIIDVRGEGGLAIFEDESIRVVCLTHYVNGDWVDVATSVEVGQSSGPAVALGGGTSTIEGLAVSYLIGTLPEGKSCAKFTIENGKQALASCAAGRFVMWFPSTIAIDAGSVEYF